MATLICALLVAITASYVSTAAYPPSLTAPHSHFVTVPVFQIVFRAGSFFFGHPLLWRVAMAGPPALMFLSWCWFLFVGRQQIPRRSFIALVIFAAASLWVGSAAWVREPKTCPPDFIYVMLFFNVAILGVLFLLYRDNFRVPTYRSNLLFHTMLFMWLTYCAFPDFGPYPVAACRPAAFRRYRCSTAVVDGAGRWAEEAA